MLLFVLYVNLRLFHTLYTNREYVTSNRMEILRQYLLLKAPKMRMEIDYKSLSSPPSICKAVCYILVHVFPMSMYYGVTLD
jgi:hypothetical protein